MREFIASDPYPVERETDPKTGDYLFRVREVEKPPAILGLMAGDFVHNLRSALDNLVWELARLTTSHPGMVSFPVYRSKAKFAVEAVPMLHPVPVAAFDLIEEFQPYHREKPESHELAILNSFWNRDKHRTPLPILSSNHLAGVAAWGEPEDLPIFHAYFGPLHDRKIVGRITADSPNKEQQPHFPFLIQFGNERPIILIESLVRIYEFVSDELFMRFDPLFP